MAMAKRLKKPSLSNENVAALPSEFVKRFHEVEPLYKKLADEIAFSLEKRLREKAIPFAHVTHRTKKFDSLTEKLERKHYEDPWTEVTDFAGVRVVFLYPTHRPQIESLVEKEFKIVEKVDKLAALDDNQFGYGALHYIVRLSDATSGARYEDLKDLVCEIQVRTVMQDAWAIIDHHLVYKNEASTPSKLKRKLNIVSGMFENIDDQFDRMLLERELYVKEVAKQAKTELSFLQQELNFETLIAYAGKHFSELKNAKDDEHVNTVVAALSKFGFKTLENVDSMMKRTKKAFEPMSKKIPSSYAVSQIARALALVSPEYRRKWTPAAQAIFTELALLIEPSANKS